VFRTPIHRSLPRLATGAAVLALGLGGLTACGSSSSGSASGSSSSSTGATTGSSSAETSASATSGAAAAAQAITATEQDFSISLSEDHLKAGSYTITVVNNGSATHDLAVEENGTTKAKSDKVSPGGKTTLTVDLDAGKYVFYCSVSNHRAMGMQKTVQVQ
jgi:plastocyanin